MSPEETAGSVEMALGMWGVVGPSNHVLEGGRVSESSATFITEP